MNIIMKLLKSISYFMKMDLKKDNIKTPGFYIFRIFTNQNGF